MTYRDAFLIFVIASETIFIWVLYFMLQKEKRVRK